jgi:hypothetical protein
MKIANTHLLLCTKKLKNKKPNTTKYELTLKTIC